VAGIAVVAAAVAVLAVGANGMSVTDEKDKRMYGLSGDMSGVRPGEARGHDARL
jgi:hypothetical protein